LGGFGTEPAAPSSAPSPAKIVAMRFQTEPAPGESTDIASSPTQFVLASAVSYPAYVPPPGSDAGSAAAAEPTQPNGPAPPPQAVRENGTQASSKPILQTPHPATPSSTVLNSAQIASIKDRLKLSSYQDQLWPPVESALRDIGWRKDAKGKIVAKADAHGPAIDPGSAQVQRLKSAAVPLIMSFNEDQKQEVRTLLRLMGLESLATQF
jgi:hypothetical protein